MFSGKPLAVFVVGTRAQLIKVAPVMVACELRQHPTLLLLTGQHKETMQDLVEEFGISAPQSHVVEVLERSTVFALAGWAPRAYLGLVRQLRRLKAEAVSVDVVVHGDTMSTVLGAMAARRCGIRVVHLESGLTSGKLFDPFPEEISRRIVFRLADVAICPSAEATAHMEAKYGCRAIDTHENTIADAVMMAMERTDGALEAQVPAEYVVASIHRFQNIFDTKRLRFLVDFLSRVAERYTVYFVLHPSTRKRLESEGLWETLSAVEGVKLTPRLSYRDFLSLASKSACVLTDGGSNQEELAILGVPTIVMRQHTERQDGLGDNALMEASLGTGTELLEYCVSGRFEELRRPTRVKKVMGPSLIVAQFLAG